MAGGGERERDNKATLAKARRELEELYLGVPDESVNLTFGYLADVNKQQQEMMMMMNSSKTTTLVVSSSSSPSALNKLPSLDFNRSIQSNYHHDGHIEEEPLARGHHDHHHVVAITPNRQQHYTAAHGGVLDQAHIMNNTTLSYDHDVTSDIYPERSGRRPGIPHSNICTICSTYIYIFRHRCLVCGRVYCRSCLSLGMGEMTEGRKCVECLGRRFSQRYIQRAGKIGWCARYASMVKLQELKWAEKGPRKSGERGYNNNRSVIMSRSRSPATPTRAHVSNSPSSFVINSPYSAYSPTRSPIPF